MELFERYRAQRAAGITASETQEYPQEYPQPRRARGVLRTSAKPHPPVAIDASIPNGDRDEESEES